MARFLWNQKINFTPNDSNVKAMETLKVQANYCTSTYEREIL
jgi:hypothetical protein